MLDQKAWAKKALINIAKPDTFLLTERSKRYNRDIWKLLTAKDLEEIK